ncbi:hypothetical protein BT69DRAFT_1318726 [Atractiella rhizophila]|nr:hypothetical protein BT69DRAFT_1318726 [Atractiella rhizophila]
MSNYYENNMLPGVRRIVTGHNAEGKAIFIHDETFKSDPVGRSGKVGFKALYETEKVPANNDDPFHDPMFNDVNDIANKEGTILRIVDYAPTSKDDKPYVHRTESVDYGIVMSGEITCVLDSGEEKIIHAGDVVIQRGTSHGWINHGEEWCRIIFTSIATHPARIGDKVLGREGYLPEHVATKGHKPPK